MAQVEQNKKGGPYTKREQDERRKQVFNLHYEKNYPIVKIASILNVSRNTISDDVKQWNKQFTEEFEQIDVSTWMASNLLRLESQKMRLLEEAEKTDQIQTKLGFEKLAFALESKIGQVGLDLLKNKKETIVHEDPEKEIKEIVMHLININKKQDCLLTQDEIEYEILKLKKCDKYKIECYFDQMNDFGLEYSLIDSEDDDKAEVFDIKKFAEIRGYI